MGAARCVIGLVGQVCAGKSAVAEAFWKRGAKVCEADAIVHALYGRADVQAEVRALFGAGIFEATGAVDRKKLGALVFADPAKLETLTRRVIFPRTGKVLRARIKDFRGAAAPDAARALVLDAPTLFESGREDWCDRLLFVGASRAARRCWARERRGWPDGELERREARLMDAREKQARCQAWIENDGSLDDLDRQVGELWKRWIGEEA